MVNPFPDHVLLMVISDGLRNLFIGCEPPWFRCELPTIGPQPGIAGSSGESRPQRHRDHPGKKARKDGNLEIESFEAVHVASNTLHAVDSS
jgi:hypothetical protein